MIDETAKHSGIGRLMRSLALVAMASLSLAPPISQAVAGSLEATPAAPLAYDWTGFHLGASLGYGVGRNATGVGFPGFFADPQPQETFTQSGAGVLGGLEGGYDWQFGRALFGVQGDWQWSAQAQTACVFVCDDEGTVKTTQRLQAIGTLRGRIGVVSGGTLLYATGGLAFAKVDTDIGLIRSLSGMANAASFHHSPTGWTMGAGIETALGGHWTTKIEYLYADLGHISDSFDTPDAPSAPITTQITSDLREHIVRAGINYRFGGTDLTSRDSSAAFPAEDLASAPVNWTGFYLGGNLGYGVSRNPSELGLVSTIAAFTPQPERFTLTPAGITGGVGAGYNWQAGHFVAGIEADIQGSGQADAACMQSCEIPFQYDTVRQRISWLATVRGRIGYVTGPALLYVTGGYAAAGLKNEIQTTLGTTWAASFDHTLSGAAIGGGIETAVSANWSVKLEYLHMDFGHLSDDLAVPSPLLASNVATRLAGSIRDDVVRAGVNYRFGASPTIRKY
jgi:outer membrane immunogenic protein